MRRYRCVVYFYLEERAMRLPFVRSSAKDIRENPGKTSLFTKAGVTLFALGLLFHMFDRWLDWIDVVAGILVLCGVILLFLGRNGNDDPAERLK